IAYLAMTFLIFPFCRAQNIGNTLLDPASEPFVLTLQTRNEDDQILVETKKTNGSRIAIVVMDMWDRHGCDSITRQIDALIPSMDKTLAVARELGISIVFSPTGATGAYRDTPQQKAMKRFHHGPVPQSSYTPK